MICILFPKSELNIPCSQETPVCSFCAGEKEIAEIEEQAKLEELERQWLATAPRKKCCACGESFVIMSNVQRRCPDCAEERARENNKRRQARFRRKKKGIQAPVDVIAQA